MPLKKKILIDLDVITVELWDSKGENKRIANEFIRRVENKEFFVVTPYSLLELVSKWKYTALKDEIEEFYLKKSDMTLSNKDVDAKIDSIGIDDVSILLELERNAVKGEDALLALISSIFDIDYLVTFNRKHLRNKTKIINEVLKENGLKPIQIVGPEEI